MQEAEIMDTEPLSYLFLSSCVPYTITSLMSSSSELFQRAQQLIPGGVNSPVRAFRSVGSTPF